MTAAMDPPTLRLRLAGPDDDAGIRALLAAAFGDNVKSAAAFTRWQYWDNPFGTTRSWVWEDAGRIVSHWAALPVPILLDGRRVTGAKGADIATAASYRGRGLFARLARRLVADCRDRGVPVLLSHPNPRSARGVQTAGGRLVGRVPVYVLPLDDAWLARRVHLPRTLVRALRAAAFRGGAGDPAGEVGDPPEGLDGLWADAGGAACGVVRDGAWWAWRYAARPVRPYRFLEVRRRGRLRGAAVATAREVFGARFLLVLELLASDAAAAAGLGRALRRIAGDAVGVAHIALPGTRPALAALAAGFRRLPRRLEPHPLRFLVVGPAGDSQELARRRWSLTWGDLDHL